MRSVTWNAAFTNGAENLEIHRKLQGRSALGSNILLIMADEIPLLILNISVARTLRHPLCMETEPSFSKRFSNDDVLSLYITKDTS